MIKDRYRLGEITNPKLWELLGGGWLLEKLTGSLYHSHTSNENSCEIPFYYVSAPKFRCRHCGAEPPAGIKFKAKFTQLNNI
jgi:hypothetical protein